MSRPAVSLSDIPRWAESASDADRESTDDEINEELLLQLSDYVSPVESLAFSDSHNALISLYRGDITKLSVDAVVNAANSHLAAGGGICGAIFAAAGGSQLSAACRAIGHCSTGESVVTPAFRLPSRHIIHSVGPMDDGDGATARQLISCYSSILDRCVENNIRSVAICCISTGIYGFPQEFASICALWAIRNWLENYHNHHQKMNDNDIEKKIDENSNNNNNNNNSNNTENNNNNNNIANHDNSIPFDRIIICTFLPLDYQYYSIYLPLFFPRNEKDMKLWNKIDVNNNDENNNNNNNDIDTDTDINNDDENKSERNS